MFNLELLGGNISSVLASLTIQTLKYDWPLQVRADGYSSHTNITISFTAAIIYECYVHCYGRRDFGDNLYLHGRNVPDITTLQILNPSGVAIHASLGIFTVPNVTQSYAGTYTCVITSTLNNSTMNAVSVVIVECKLSPGL
jgi:hypothetical protein